MDTAVAVTVQEAARRLMVSPRAIWAEIASGRLRSFKVGRRRLVRVAAIEAFAERQEAQQAAQEAREARRATPTAPTAVRAAQPAPRAIRPPVPPVDDGIVLPFVILADGSVTTHAELRRRRKGAGA